MQYDTALVVHHEPQIRRLLKNALRPEIPRVLETSTGEEAIDLAAAEGPAVIVLDWELPDLGGIDICREIRKWSAAWIIVLSSRLSDRDKVRIFRVGADDYVTKPFSTLELAARIRARRRRLPNPQRLLGLEPISIEDLVVNFSARTVRRGEVPVHLTPIEWDLLRVFLAHADCTLTHSQVLEAVWGSTSDDLHRSLRTHIANLRSKIERDATRPRLILTEPAVGYRWVSERPTVV